MTAAYRPLGPLDDWVAAASPAVDAAAFGAAAEVLVGAGDAWTGLVRRGMLLAAAYRSGALAGLYEASDDVAGALLAGVAGPAGCGPAAAPHVVAIHDALLLAPGASITPAWLSAVHATACRAQETAPLPTDHGVQDHVLGHGDLKHHPNDLGGRVFAPVAQVEAQTHALVHGLAEAVVAAHPLVAAAYALHAVTHVGPFAAGNGRVARVAASVPLLAAAAAPLVVADAGGYRAALDAGDPASVVVFAGACWTGLAAAVERARAGAGQPAPAAALARWEAREAAARRLDAALAAGALAALDRHRRRRDLGWLPDLAGAEVVAGHSPVT
ncbi:MAG TPA: Fic family protein, partial [Acidimicrobiales bacterium]|nr:Fic family protein [Acidimicrobiales bacterium]